MDIHQAIEKNEYEIEKFGKNIKFISKEIPRLSVIPQNIRPNDKESWALYWLLIVSCCQNTANIQGKVNDKHVRGNDYLYLSSQKYFCKNLEKLNCSYLSKISIENFHDLFRDDYGKCNIDRVNERYTQFIQTANFLLTTYDGSMQKLFLKTKRNLFGNSGLFNIISKIKPYKDVEQKKLRVLSIFLKQSGLIDFEDFNELKLPVDYHVERVMLRLHLIEVKDENLLTKLLKSKEVDSIVDNTLRSIIAEVAVELEKYATLSEINEVLWHLGRGYCFKEGGICLDHYRENSSPVSEFEPYYKSNCPAGFLCPSYNDPVKNLIKEAYIKTSYY
ncbi:MULTISPECIES: hypothetical protein [unclassified Planococcus (in: firmicutes)]|uniref:hypothetical protein n=1 Tax=unclassified Planococcus (in: firmicutes) TaxID=2662419 RepID=UPI000C7A85B7|nr:MULTISPECIES: hypothetical protein [unclassified Planococcus (in: firmicutes)]PKG48913.1 hypothetical protein CXF66_00035 [Planococcus sp. Urea-trap-24]PKG89688.1 hypothetical protein CXF91_05755 [Planococcus sp. Urea-3u-39]